MKVPRRPPPPSDLIGTWCSPGGDRLRLAGDHFTLDPLSSLLAGQIDYRFTAPGSGPDGWPRPNAPAPAAARGLWGVSDLVLDIRTDEIDGRTVMSDPLEFQARDRGARWAFSLPLKPAGSGEVPFDRCRPG